MTARGTLRILRPSFLFAVLALGFAMLQPGAAAPTRTQPPREFTPRAEQLYQPVLIEPLSR